MEKAMNSAMVEERMNEIIERKNAIAEEVESKKEEFESASTEERDTILDSVEELTNEADEIDKEVEELEEQRSVLKAQEERMSLAKSVSPIKVEERKNEMEEKMDVRSTPEFVHAWREAVMSGNEQNLRSLFTVLKTDEPEGTVPVPTYVQSRVEATWERLSILNEVSISALKGIIAVPYEVSTTGASYHAEGDVKPDEESLVIGQVLLQPKTIKKWLRVSSEVEALSDEEFMNYVVDEIIYQINLFLENEIVGEIAQSTLAEIVDSALSFNAVNDGLAELTEVFDPVVIVNRKTFFGEFMGLTDLQGRPIYSIAADNEGRPRYFLNGIRVLFNNTLPTFDNANQGDVYAIVGDLKALRVNFPNGRIPSVLYDPYTEAEADLSKYVGKLMAAFGVVRPKSLAVIRKPEE